MSSPLSPQDLVNGFELAGIGHAVTLTDGTIERCSRTFTALTGIDCADAAARRIPWFRYDPSPPHVKDQRAALWADFLDRGEPWRGTVKWFLPGGGHRYFEGTAIRQPEGRVLLITNDHTDRVEADRTLRTRERNRQQVINDLPISLSLFDQHGRIILINPYLPNRLGLEADGLTGLPSKEALGDTVSPLTDDIVAELAATGTPIEGRQVAISRGPLAGTHWLIYGRSLISEHPSLDRLMVLAVDRTDSVRLREERAQFAEAIHQSQKIAALNDFAGNLAHELSNLLHPVGAYARLLAGDPHHPQGAQYAQKINKGTMAAGRILRRTLSMARLDRGEIGAVDVAAIVRDTLASAEDLAPDGLVYRLHAPETVLMAQAEEGELRQVMLNLLNNAAEAMHYRGQITVSVEVVSSLPDGLDVMPTGEPPFVAIDVTDTGPGMPPEVRKRAFDPFFTTKPSGRGTGLGLPVVQGLVTRWGGVVYVTSEVDRGTTFCVLIPQDSAAD